MNQRILFIILAGLFIGLAGVPPGYGAGPRCRGGHAPRRAVGKAA